MRPTVEMLRRLFIVDSEAGKLWWRERTPDLFKDGYRSAEHSCNAWNSRYAGKEAFAVTDNSYIQGKIFGQIYHAHRIIFAMATGAWPEDEIDHINRRRGDNRISNLRAVSRQENLRNQKLSKSNKSGHLGVSWHKPTKKWYARIKVDQKNIYLGRFENIEHAIAARDAANIEYGFHANHGKKVANAT